MKVKLVLVLFVASWVLTACSGFGGPSILDVVKDKYTLDDTVKSSVDSDDTSHVFVADQSIPEVAKTLEKEMSPDRASKESDGKQVLVYEDYFVTLTKNEKDPAKTNIEVATYGFVRDNYNPSFFDGLLTYALLSQLFGVNNWAGRQGDRCFTTGGCYQGYNRSGGHYKGPGSTPLFRTSPFRGGGPGAGK